jgi:hypothetical protein
MRGYDNATTVIEAFKAHYRRIGQGVTVLAYTWPHGCVYVVPEGPDMTSRAQRHVTVELFNGSVCVDEHLRDALGASERPVDPTDPDRKQGVRISATEPLGASCGANYGKFRWGLTFQEIETRWGSAANFVALVADRLSQLPCPRASLHRVERCSS